MPHRIRVGDIMTRKFIHLKPETELIRCAKTMIKKRIGSLVLKENDDIKGIITERDIIWAVAKKGGKNLSEVQAKDIASRKVISIKPEASLDEALIRMNKKKVRSLPVISNKKLIGYITFKDILKFRPSLLESLREFQNIKEESKKLKRSESAIKGNFIEAPCEGCGNFDILSEIDDKMICESCRDML